MPAVCRTPRTRSMTPEARTPGSVTTKARKPLTCPTTATSSGRASMASIPKRTRPCNCSSSDRSASSATSEHLEDDVDARVAADRQPAPAAGGVEPAFGRDAVRVLEQPDLVEVASIGALDGRGRGPALATEDELVEWPPAAPGAAEPEHQRVPAEPWSARTWSRSNRSRANGAMRAGVRPVA